MAQHTPTGQQFLVCPTYDGHWTTVDTITALGLVGLVVFLICACMLIYWRHQVQLRTRPRV